MDKAANIKQDAGGRKHTGFSIQWTKHEGNCVGVVEITGRIKETPGIALHLNRYAGRRDGRVPYAVMPTDARGEIAWSRSPIAKGAGRSIEEADELGIQALLRIANSGC